MKDSKKRFYERLGHPSAKIAETELREKLTETITRDTAGKPDSWLETRRTQMNDAWKKIHDETRSMFCMKGKHDRCTFDPDCSCECHPKKAVEA